MQVNISDDNLMIWNTRTTDPGTTFGHSLKEPGYVGLGLVLGNVADLCNLFMHVGTPTLSTIICVKAVPHIYDL